LGFDTEVTRRVTDPSVPDSRFGFTLVNRDDTSGPVVSSMSVTSFADLDDARITCLDSNIVAGNQEVNIAVLGKNDVGI
jgi:hypothetical protein